MALAGDQRDIQPGHMVADQKHRSIDRAAGDGELHAEDTQKTTAPALFGRQHHGAVRRPEGPQQKGQHNPPQQIKHDAGNPEHPAQLRPEAAALIRTDADAIVHCFPES